MIKCCLAKLMQERNLTIKELSKISKVSKNTIMLYCSNKIKRINFKTLNSFCKTLDCNTSDIFKIEI